MLSTGETIGVENMPIHLTPTPTEPKVGDLVSLESIEEMHIRQVLAATKSLEEAARILGMDPVTLWRRRKKYGSLTPPFHFAISEPAISCILKSRLQFPLTRLIN